MLNKKWWLIGLGAALLLATLSPLASGSPDGLEKVAGDHDFIGFAKASPFRVIADYAFPGVHNQALATILAGWLGVLVVFGAVYGLTRLLIKRKKSV